MTEESMQKPKRRKQSKTRRLFRVLLVKRKQWLTTYRKWKKRYLPFRKKRDKGQFIMREKAELGTSFQTSHSFKNFFTLPRIVTFITLFLGVGGAYLWFYLTSHYLTGEGGWSSSLISEYVSQGGGAQQSAESTSVAASVSMKGADSAPIINSTAVPFSANSTGGEEKTAFSMQPYIQPDTQIPLIKTINPQFFIQAADNQSQKTAILIVGLGINEALTDQILSQVPENVSLVFSPYSPDLEGLIDFAQYAGFATLVAAPMEDEDPITDQGYLTLKTRISEEQNLENLKKITLSAVQADCLYGQGGARFFRSVREMKLVFQYMREKNNCFVAPPDVLVSQFHEVAAALRLNYVCTTIENPTDSMMPSIEALTKRTGFSILAFDAKPGVIDEIKGWIKKLEEAKLSIVPITEIIYHE